MLDMLVSDPPKFGFIARTKLNRRAYDDLGMIFIVAPPIFKLAGVPSPGNFLARINVYR